jgi:hypothetical protein
MVKDWDYDETDYVRLMKSFLQKRIDAASYTRQLWDMNKGRALFASDEASIVIQKALGDADDYDPIVRLQYTIEEPALRVRVEDSVKQLEALGFRVDD